MAKVSHYKIGKVTKIQANIGEKSYVARNCHQPKLPASQTDGTDLIPSSKHVNLEAETTHPSGCDFWFGKLCNCRIPVR